MCKLTWQDVWKGEYIIDRSMCKLVLHTYIMTVKRWGWVYKALSRTELDSEHFLKIYIILKIFWGGQF